MQSSDETISKRSAGGEAKERERERERRERRRMNDSERGMVRNGRGGERETCGLSIRD